MPQSEDNLRCYLLTAYRASRKGEVEFDWKAIASRTGLAIGDATGCAMELGGQGFIRLHGDAAFFTEQGRTHAKSLEWELALTANVGAMSRADNHFILVFAGTSTGCIPRNDLRRNVGRPPDDVYTMLDKFVRAGTLVERNGNVCLTPTGWALSEIARDPPSAHRRTSQQQISTELNDDSMPILFRNDWQLTEFGLAFVTTVVELEADQGRQGSGIVLYDVLARMRERGYPLRDEMAIRAFSLLDREAYVNPGGGIALNNRDYKMFVGSTTYAAKWAVYKAAKAKAIAANEPIPAPPPPPFTSSFRPNLAFHIPPVKLTTTNQVAFILACYEASIGGLFGAKDAATRLGIPNDSVHDNLHELIKLNVATQYNYGLTAAFSPEGRRMALHIFRSGFAALSPLWTKAQKEAISKALHSGGRVLIPFELASCADDQHVWHQLEARMVIDRIDERRAAVFTELGFDCVGGLLSRGSGAIGGTKGGSTITPTPARSMKPSLALNTPKKKPRTPRKKKPAEGNPTNADAGKEPVTPVQNSEGKDDVAVSPPNAIDASTQSLASPAPHPTMPTIHVNISPHFQQTNAQTVTPPHAKAKKKKSWTFWGLIGACALALLGVVWAALADAHKEIISGWLKDHIPYLRSTTNPSEKP